MGTMHSSPNIRGHTGAPKLGVPDFLLLQVLIYDVLRVMVAREECETGRSFSAHDLKIMPRNSAISGSVGT